MVLQRDGHERHEGVNWVVNSCSNGSDGCGSFSPSQTTDTGSAVYTGPNAISSGSSITVTFTASLVDNPAVSAQAGLTIVSAGSPGLLGTGWFTFYVTGSDSSQNDSSYAPSWAGHSVITAISPALVLYTTTGAFGPYPASTLSGTLGTPANGRYVGTVTVTVNGTPYTLNQILYAGVNNNNTVLSLETDKFGTGGQSFLGPGVGLLQIQNLTTPSLSQPLDKR